MNCSSCLARCKADCCHGPIPMPKDYLERFPQVRPATVVVPAPNDMVLAMHVGEDRRAVCPFLGLDHRCSIYDHRPTVCRLFGNATHAFLTCSFKAPDGRMRERPERRAIERMHAANKGQLQHRLSNQHDPST